MSAPAGAARKRKRRKPKPGCVPAKPKRKKAKKSALAHPAAAKKRRKPRCKKRKTKPKLRPQATHPAPARPAAGPAPVAGPAPPVPPPPAPPAGRTLNQISSPIAVYQGAFGPRQAERLLWRAGFGPRPGDVERVAKLDLEQAVLQLTRPTGAAPMHGAAPVVDGQPLSPLDTWYGDHIYWFDRMVRSGHQLVERLALVFHDWWATSNDGVGSNEMMLAQTNVFRAHGLGSFRDMTRAITTDPAMLVFLNGIDNRRNAVNENYARELMELFTLGADRGAYTETDVRELARALTGWRADWSGEEGLHDFRFDANRWDQNPKTVFGKRGNWNWEDACRLVLEHPMHASFFVTKLWSYFIPTPPSADVRGRLEKLYVGSGLKIRPVLEAILCSPQFHEGPRMTKPPAVLAAGMLRAQGKSITGAEWAWLGDGAGQRLYYPPDVSGWDDARWLDSNTVRGRWDIVNYAVAGRTVNPNTTSYGPETPEEAVKKALAFWLDPHVQPETREWLLGYAREFQPQPEDASSPAWLKNDNSRRRAWRQNGLRHLLAVSADYQTC